MENSRVQPAKATDTIAGKTLPARLAVTQGQAKVRLEAGAAIGEGEILEIALNCDASIPSDL